LAIEERMNTKLAEYDANEDDVLKHLNEATTAKKVAALNLDDAGFFSDGQRKKRSKPDDDE